MCQRAHCAGLGSAERGASGAEHGCGPAGKRGLLDCSMKSDDLIRKYKTRGEEAGGAGTSLRERCRLLGRNRGVLASV
jgi:hypothetical protein